jgi:PAS domain S-box-containing protein
MASSKRHLRYPILIVEDDRVSRHFLATTLEKSGYRAMATTNGREALAEMEQRHYPMVISDWNMPEMDGVELCRAIRAGRWRSYVYVLLLTSRDSIEDIVAGLEAGADEYLRKPFEKEELLARLNTGLRYLEMEASLKRSKGYAESILASMVDAVFVLKTDQTIQKVNAATCNLLGYAEKDLVGKTMGEFLAEDPDVIHAQCEEVKRTGHIGGRELNVRTRGGKTIPVSFNSSVLFFGRRKGMQPSGVICVARDITEQKDAEQKLKDTLQELETTQEMLIQSEKLASIGHLASGVAHEILNPTNIVSIRLQLLERTESLSSKARDVLDVCKAQLKRITHITQDLNKFSRASTKTVRLCNINAILEWTLNLYTPQFRLENVDVVTKMERSIPKLLLDRELLEEVLLNLYSNAIGAMQESDKKSITIASRHLAENGRVRVTVSDTGVGIPTDAINKIFDPYFSTKPPGEGTGLGLFLSYGIVKDQGGQMWAENRASGTGAEMHIEFPVPAGDT